MEIFFTADSHFDHANIIKHAERPFDNVDHMNESLVERWNEMIPSGGRALVYILGDFAWRNHAYWLNRLSGKKVLVKGNHDKMSGAVLRQFTDVFDIRNISVNRQNIILCHYRLCTWPGEHRGQWHFYGHSHGRMAEEATKKACDVGVDVWNYQPVPYEVLAEKMHDRLSRPYDPKRVAAAKRRVIELANDNSKYREKYERLKASQKED